LKPAAVAQGAAAGFDVSMKASMKTNTSTGLNYSYFINIIGAGAFLVAALWLISSLIADGLFPLASILGAIAIFIALVYLRPRFSPYRWLGIGVVLALLFTVYPIAYTFVISVTNMGSGHLMSKNQAIERLEAQQFLPDDGASYEWAAFRSPTGEYALWLVTDEGQGLLAKPGQALQTVAAGAAGVSELDEDGFPTQLEGYQRLIRREVVPIITDLSALEFGEPPNTVRIRSLGEAVASQPLYRYDASRDVIIDQQTGEEYRPIEGTFTSASGETLTPGYIELIGLRHFIDFLSNPGFREPLLRIFIWNLAFTFFSVFFSFVVGLIATLMFDDLPGKKIIRALLIIPWPIPVLISVLIWRNMFNPDLGFITPVLESMFGSSPAWFQDPFWTRVALVMVNVWLSYPYFYVITAGALRAIPDDVYDAAVVDGAGAWQKFSYITLPLLLRILTPLLIASLTFNFNNFNVIYIFNFGNPPMANTAIPMGHTDILISFVYQLAFVTSNVANYGLAAAITIILFLLITTVVILQIRYANMFKEAD
jgi:ABC-type sugar transport system permease subunit